MDITQNIKESLTAIRSRPLRSTITITTIAIGIICLVGMLTAVEALRSQILSDFSAIGANTLTVETLTNRGSRRRNAPATDAKAITFANAQAFADRFDRTLGTPSILNVLSSNATIRHANEKTSPNKVIIGGDRQTLQVQGVNLALGRNFTQREIDGGNYVAIIGHEINQSLFESQNIEPIGSYVLAEGVRFTVIGVLEEIGSSEKEDERYVLIPVHAARRLALPGQVLRYQVSVAIHNVEQMDGATVVAEQLMRKIRRDKPKKASSFQVKGSDTAVDTVNRYTGILRTFGYVIGLITLAGACVGLMNIMLVYVKERTREIGLRKAVGATPWEVKAQFLTEAIVICQIGGIVGIVVGIVLGNLTASLINAAFVFPYTAAIIGVIVSTLTGVIAGYIPAKNAAKVDPILSLRYE